MDIPLEELQEYSVLADVGHASQRGASGRSASIGGNPGFVDGLGKAGASIPIAPQNINQEPQELKLWQISVDADLHR